MVRLAVLGLLLSSIAVDAKIGVLGQSGGDIQHCSEVESWTKNFFFGSLLPARIPTFVRHFIANRIWSGSGNDTLEEYHAVGPDCNTRFRDLSEYQTEAIVDQIKKLTKRTDVQGFAGWKFNYGPGNPEGITVMDAFGRMQEEGVTEAFIYDQDDMAYDDITLAVTIAQAREYLANHPEWNVTINVFNGFTNQTGYFELLVNKLKKQIAFAYPGVPANDICIVFPAQGVPKSKESAPGSGVRRLRELTARLREALPGYNMTNVFNNKGGKGFKFPQNLQAWSDPCDKTKIPQMAKEYPCGHVLVAPILEWPQVDYNVYVFHANGTSSQAGYEKVFKDAGKAYKGMPSWDQTEEEWTGKPPQGKPTVGPELPAYIASLVKDVVAGKGSEYDLTVIHQGALADGTVLSI